jgi:protein involved in polysaccharide export with SLBB domain
MNRPSLTVGNLNMFPRFQHRLRAIAIGLACWASLSTGCAQLTNPAIDGVPARRVPEEYLGTPRDAYKPIPLDLLRQKPNKNYTLDQGDILGLYIDKILGEQGQTLPFRISEQQGLPPAIGFPIPVQEGGIVILPSVDPIDVKGKTLREAQDLIREAYTVKKQIIQADKFRMVATLMQPRTYQILVVREDSGQMPTGTANPAASFGSVVINNQSAKSANGYALFLPAGENDILNALSRTGGLPGEGGKAEIIIQRNTNPTDLASPATANRSFIRVPLKLKAGEPWPFDEEDIQLKDGDIVYVESRKTEYFYTAGLIGVGQYPLPRDSDLDVIEAISMVRGPLLNGAYSQTAFGGGFAAGGGLGNPNPTFVTILRKLENDRQLNIRVDVVRAFRDPRERIRLLPGDLMVMQWTPAEAMANYFNYKFRYNFFAPIIRQGSLNGSLNLDGFGPP